MIYMMVIAPDSESRGPVLIKPWPVNLTKNWLPALG